jgi:hypothetical protein
MSQTEIFATPIARRGSRRVERCLVTNQPSPQGPTTPRGDKKNGVSSMSRTVDRGAAQVVAQAPLALYIFGDLNRSILLGGFPHYHFIKRSSMSKSEWLTIGVTVGMLHLYFVIWLFIVR